MATLLRNFLPIHRKKGIMIFPLLVLLLFSWGDLSYAESQKTVRIGVLVDGPYWFNKEFLKHIKKELNELNAGTYKIVFPAEATLNGDYNLNKIRRIARALVSGKKVDVIIAIGGASSGIFFKMDPLPLPVVAITIFMPLEKDRFLPKTFQPKNPNWTTSFDPSINSGMVALIPKLVSLTDSTFLCSAFMCGNQPEYYKVIKDLFAGAKINTQVKVVSPENYVQVLSQIDSPLVVVGPLHEFSRSQKKDLYQKLAGRKTPTFTIEGRYGIENGALVSFVKYDFERFGKIYALKIMDILSGTPPNKIPVVDLWKTQLTFNRETVRKIDYEIPLEFFYEADFYGPKESKPQLSLVNSIQKALDQNVDIKIQALIQNQVFSNYEITRSRYLPQLNSKLSYNRQDNTRADVFPTARGETLVELELRQKLIDLELYKDIQSSKYQNLVEQKNTEVINQDITVEIALAYMESLLQEEIVSIRKEFLRLIRKNLDIAQLKFNLGETSLNDVLRLQIDLENARIDLVNDTEALFNSQIQLNILMNQPRENTYDLDFDSFSHGAYTKRKAPFDRFLNTQKGIRILRDFFTEETFSYSVELQSIEASIQQAEADKQGTKASFLPKLDFSASYFNQIDSDVRNFTSSAEEQSYKDSTGDGWTANLELNIPLFEGGQRFKQLDRANSRLLEQFHRKENLKLDLARRARTGFFSLYRNRQNTDIFIRNVKNSKENLDLITISYIQGDIPIIDLLNSQTNLILSQINSITARYEFYKSLFRLFRTMGRTDLITGFLDEGKMRLLRNRMINYYVIQSKRESNAKTTKPPKTLKSPSAK